MTKAPKEYLRKNVAFDPLDEEDKKLYEDLQKLPYGEFSRKTKEFWIAKMKESERFEEK